MSFALRAVIRIQEICMSLQHCFLGFCCSHVQLVISHNHYQRCRERATNKFVMNLDMDKEKERWHKLQVLLAGLFLGGLVLVRCYSHFIVPIMEECETILPYI